MPGGLGRFLKRVVAVFRGPSRDREIDQELAFHLESLTREGRRAGLSEAAAARAARRRFGNVLRVKEDAHDVQSVRFVEDVLRDGRFAARGLRRNPGFTAAAVLTLALGIGSSVGLFTVVHTVLLRPLPFADQDRLVLMWERDDSAQNPHIEVSLPNFEDWRARAVSFETMTAMGSTTWGEAEVQQDPPIRLTVQAVSASFFDTLGAQAAVGRTFLPEEDGPAAPRVMVLSHTAWREFFALDPAVVGTTVPVGADEEPYTVVGVMPPAFQFPAGAQMWTPLGPALGGIFRQNAMDRGAQRGLGVLYVIGRLAPGRTLEQAEAELDVLIPSVWAQLSRNETRRVVITPLADAIFGDAALALYGLLGGVALLLLITVANVTGLMVVRSHARRREVAVRTALGTSRGRLFRAQLLETLLISSVGAGVGLGLARLGLPVMVGVGPANLPRLEEAAVDGWGLALAGLLAVVCAVGMTLAVSSQWGRVSVMEWLRDATPGATAGRDRTRTRNVLVVSEVAMALVLVVTAGLLTRSYLNVSRQDLGYRTSGVLTVGVTPRYGAYADEGERRLAYQHMLTAMDRLPGVTATGAVSLVPFQFGVVGVDAGIVLEGEFGHGPARDSRPSVAALAVSPGYFAAMGIDLLAGRDFTERDTAARPAAVIVGESLARALWPRDDALGQRLIAIGTGTGTAEDPVWHTVVGVVRDARYREIERARDALYVPFAQSRMGVSHLVLRTTTNPTDLVAPVQDEIRRLDPNLVVGEAATLERIVSTVTRPWRFTMLISSVFGLLALLLAAIGLFGTVAQSVAERTREIGVRRALGARTGEILRVVVRQAIRLTGFGTAVGLVVTLAANRLIAPLLFRIEATDTRTLVSLTALLVVVAALASVFAACRAISIDPMVALQAE